MALLDEEIAAFEEMRKKLEAEHLGKWALIHDRALVGAFDTFDAAGREATRRFGRGPYLIRQVGASQPTLGASVLFQPV